MTSYNRSIFPPRAVNYLMFVAICVIWGSSFILMKLGLYDASRQPLLSASQVAAIRIISAGLVMLPVLMRHRRDIPVRSLGWLVLSGCFGSLLPAFLFCIAETRIDSALAGTLNSLTPVFAIILGFVFFGDKISPIKIAGIIIGFGGILLLYFIQKHGGNGQIGYASLVILATLLYAINVIVVKHYLQGVAPLLITAFSLVAISLPSLLILWQTGFFALPLHDARYLRGCAAIFTLGVFGTAVAWMLYYILIQRTTILFTSTTSYGVPFVAFVWGWYYGEAVTLAQVACLFIILAGVYLTRVDTERFSKKLTK